MTGPSDNQPKTENLPNSRLYCPGRPQSENKEKQRNKYLDLARELKKNYGTWRLLPDYSIINISQNTEKSLEDLRRLVASQTPMRNPWLMLVWKTHKRE